MDRMQIAGLDHARVGSCELQLTSVLDVNPKHLANSTVVEHLEAVYTALSEIVSEASLYIRPVNARLLAFARPSTICRDVTEQFRLTTLYLPAPVISR